MRRFIFLLLFSASLLSLNNSTAQVLTTFAGNGVGGYSGDGGPATSAQIYTPWGLMEDKNGNIYIGDDDNSLIRKVDPSGIITTIAGNNIQGDTGDGGPATQAEIAAPISMCMDNSGNIYFIDGSNFLVRKIDKNGIITTIAGKGAPNTLGDGGPAINAKFENPTQICIDNAGNLYVTDVVQNRIRKIDTNGIITTIAGSGSLGAPGGYSGDNGPANSATLNGPMGMAIAPSGDIYFADAYNYVIRKIDKNGIITTVYGKGTYGYSGDNGPATAAQWNIIYALFIDKNNNIYFGDPFNYAVRKIDVNGIITTIAGNGTYSDTWNDQQMANQTSLGQPTAVLVDNDGTIYFSDLIQQVIREIKPCINPHIILQPDDTSVCVGRKANFSILGDSIPLGYQWEIDSVQGFMWMTDNGPYINSDNNTLTIKNVTATMNGYRFRCAASYENVCGANSVYTNIFSQAATLTVLPSSTNGTAIINASSNNICAGSPVIFTTATQNIQNIISYQWQLNGINTGSNNNTYVNNNLSNDDKVNCIITTSSNTCAAPIIYSDTSIINVAATPSITIYPSDTTVSTNSSVKLNAIIQGDYNSYEWDPASALSNASSLQPETSPLTATASFQLKVSYGNNCQTIKTAIINVKTLIKELYIPNSFTPNGDGINDVFRIPPGIEFNLTLLTIYDKWGNKVFSTNDINTTWDGTYKGSQCNAGNYVYVISGSDGNGKKVLKGNLLLIR